MGKQTSGGLDLAVAVVSGTFSGTGQSSSVLLKEEYNLSLDFAGTASVNLERSYDAGSTWKVIETYTADFEGTGLEIEAGVLYRLNCTAHTDNVTYRLSR